MAEKKRVVVEEEEGCVGGEGDGVLLYYKYALVSDLPGLVRLYDSNCRSLGLLGRVRISTNGVNVTVGGKMSSLEKHIAVMKSNSLFEGTDFKLASCAGPTDDRIAMECGFTSLSIRVVEELVTFRSQPLLKSPDISNAGRHLSAIDFHSVLQGAGNVLDCKGSMQHKQLLLLDARNVYETRIGMFQTPNVETLNPDIRQYSDLPAWIDKHSEQLHGNCVLMYCTGGIRCEMASAYIRSKGAGYENVYQLFGGIQRYLEQFPDGGFFKGRNFVFDHRVSIGSQDADIVGSCQLCGSSFDDYSSRCRCTYCRMLVLVCDSCQSLGKSGVVYVCELCRKHHEGGDPMPLMGDDQFHSGFSSDLSGAVEQLELGSAISSDHVTHSLELPRRHGNGPARKLRILCLHGFRQNASSFKGRTASLAKKLKSIAEFIFVDAPHELPFIYQPRSNELSRGSIDSLPEQTNSVTCSSQHPPPRESCKKRFAWLISPMSNCSVGSDWKMPNQPFDPLQYQQQTDGFEESYAYLEKVFSQMGPFDGVLGFSQGAAMAAFLCEQQWRTGATPDFRFAILCSGFSLFSKERNQGALKCPSLHIYGNSRGKDRQIACQASMELASLFDKSCSVVIEHDSGHIIPTQPPYIDQMRAFLRHFR